MGTAGLPAFLFRKGTTMNSVSGCVAIVAGAIFWHGLITVGKAPDTEQGTFLWIAGFFFAVLMGSGGGILLRRGLKGDDTAPAKSN